MVMWATSGGGRTSSSSATPVKSSMYTCRYRGSQPCSPPCVPARRRARAQRSAALGGGCSSSKRACCRCAHAATSVDSRSK
eukprot:2181670-Pleurochrysis_carterae.AAC.1